MELGALPHSWHWGVLILSMELRGTTSPMVLDGTTILIILQGTTSSLVLGSITSPILLGALPDPCPYLTLAIGDTSSPMVMGTLYTVLRAHLTHGNEFHYITHGTWVHYLIHGINISTSTIVLQVLPQMLHLWYWGCYFTHATSIAITSSMVLGGTCFMVTGRYLTHVTGWGNT